MQATRLRVYHGPDTTGTADAIEKPAARQDAVTLPASDIIPLLADAHASRRTWLEDFGDDEITVSSDLYEVLVAYRFFNRGA